MPDKERDPRPRVTVEPLEAAVADRVDREPLLGTPRAASPLVASSAGDVSAPARPAIEIQNPMRRRGAPGRTLGGEEAAREMGRMAMPEDEARRAADLLGNMRTEGLVPEFTNAQAMAMRARRRMAGPAVEHRAIGAPAAVAAIAARPAVQVPATPNVPMPVQPVPPPPPRNLPAVAAGQDVALRAAPYPVDAPEPRWYTVYDAPGFMEAPIRRLGHDTFSTFPCYQGHRQLELAKGEDPLGTVRFVASIPGVNTDAEINTVARWIMENGLPLSPHQIAIPAIPGYEPRVILAADETTSYLMVDERVEDGAPGNRRYVYSWQGGAQFYLQNPHAAAALQDLRRPAAIAAPAQRIAAPLPGLAGPAARPGRARGGGRGGVPAVVGAAGGVPALPLPPAINVDEERRRRARHVAALPKAGALQVGSGFTRALREAGFANANDETGPRFVRELDDGGLVVVRPQAGRSFADSDEVRAHVVSASGTASPETVVARADEIEALLEAPASPSP